MGGHTFVKTLTSAPVEPCAWECTKSASTPQDTTSASAPASSSVTKPPDSASQIQPSTPSTFHHQLEELQKPKRKKPRKKKRLKKRRKNYKKETKPVVVFGLDFKIQDREVRRSDDKFLAILGGGLFGV